MKIAIIGYGKMGRAIEELAIKNGHTIEFVINSKNNIFIKQLKETIRLKITLKIFTPNSAYLTK